VSTLLSPGIDLNDYDFHLPGELVAHEPIGRRDACRLVVLDRRTGRIEHTRFSEIGRYLNPGDTIILNDTRVIPGKYFARRPDGGRVEVSLYSRGDGEVWIVVIRPGVKLEAGLKLEGDGIALSGTLVQPAGHELWEIRYEQDDTTLLRALEAHGEMALPLYVSLGRFTSERYQTVYARVPGATQAPTAGLHFTPELIADLTKTGVKFIYITLHVGMSTYADPEQALANKRMYREILEISPQAAEEINSTKGRIIAVGTTVVRSLESVAVGKRRIRPHSGWTDLFISPGYEFKIVEAMITNFHQPKSTRILLVSAFAGRDNILATYREAVERRYMFYDFGDSTFIK
jgi:S-adenosylmethionine:tRNA ribosyltransferase-isomerase